MFLKVWDKQSTIRNSSKPWKLEHFQSLEFWDWPFRTKDFFFFPLKLTQIYLNGIIVDNIKIWAIITTFTLCASNQLFWKLDSPAHDFLLLQNCHSGLKSGQQFFSLKSCNVLISAKQQWVVAGSEILIPCPGIEPG